jgi:hypothetical protein
MNKQIFFYILGIIIVLISTPLARKLVGVVYRYRNLADEYIPILSGFIHSLIVVGILIFSIGLAISIKNKNNH